MLCPRCGKDIELSPDSRFCSGCGLEFVWQPISDDPITQEYESSNENDNPQVVLRKIGDEIDIYKKNYSSGAWIFAGFFIAVIFAIVFMFFSAIGLIF